MLFHSGYVLYPDRSYGNDSRQKLDIYIPKKIQDHPSTIIFFYGGSWQFGKKLWYRFVGQAFATQGFITVIADYRLYPQVYFPAFMDDAAKVVKWTHDHIQQYGGDANQLFLAGHSAGAHIAALLVSDTHYLNAVGASVSWIKGVIGIAGPYNFLPFTDQIIQQLFSKVNAIETQPIYFVHPSMPPFLVVTGSADTVVRPQNTISFAQKLRHNTISVTEIIYPKIGHIGIILSLARGLRFRDSLLNDISVFIVNNHKLSDKSVFTAG